MTRVDFYVLGGPAPALQFACRLIERIYRLRHTLHVRAADADQARQLDDTLWTFRAGAFVPHLRVGTPGRAPVWIGTAQDAPGTPDAVPDVVLNLADDPLPDPTRYTRVAELVPADPAQRERARAHFRHYKTAEIGRAHV